ncbi:hypothetical protein [Paramicrobacterium fandaimingii]|uniref:ApeA N-terminal domain 1-containing protein n=1 Tax=Paramicrobacterium fandaimingii TaxID=2708079 RepID=UPI001423AF19|nr:hypothetical protein [Microbacterium fandaimingii]
MKPIKLLPEWDTTTEYRGEWWPPERPQLRYPGILRFDQRRPKLTIETPPAGQEAFQLGKVATLHGELSTGQPTTLWDLQHHPLIHEQMRSGDLVRQHRRTFTYATLGENYEGYEKQLFRYSAVRFHGLDTWSQLPEPISKGTLEQHLPQHAPARLIGPYSDMFDVQRTVEVTIEHPMRVETDEYFPGGQSSITPATTSDCFSNVIRGLRQSSTTSSYETHRRCSPSATRPVPLSSGNGWPLRVPSA